MLEIRMADLGKHEIMTEDFDQWRNVGELCLKFMIAPKVKKFCMVDSGKGERDWDDRLLQTLYMMLHFNEAPLVKPPSLA